MKIICIVLSLILIFGTVYYFFPTSLLEDVVADEVGCIVVQHGSSGARFTVVGDGEIRAILQNLQSVTVKRDGLSIKEDGFGYQLTLMDQQGDVMETIIVNSSTQLRKTPFFYKLTSGETCYSYLQELEAAYSNNGDSGLHSGYLTNGDRWFEGTVKSVNGSSMQITPRADTWEAQSGGNAGITVTLRLSNGETAPTPQKGDVVRITYDGMIAESYPPQILHVHSIEIVQ